MRRTVKSVKGRRLAALGLLWLAGLAAPHRVLAQTCEYPFCEPLYQALDQALFPGFLEATEAGLDADFKTEESAMESDFFGRVLQPGLQDMASQLTATGMLQMTAIGGFLDATQQLQTQRLLQQKTALAHKNYQPSMEMCAIGTVANGIGAAYRNGETTAILLSRQATDRQMFAQNTVAAQSPDADVTARLHQFQKRYCDPQDDNLSQVCEHAAAAATVNKDIDFARTVYEPLTIDADFSDGSLSGDEQDVLALAKNLYAHKLFAKVPAEKLNQPGNQNYILDWRAVAAKRSVGENSFNAIVGMKAADNAAAPGNAKYLAAVLQQLGAAPTDAASLIGARPSYYARMELLTKKIYEEPEFYTALYDTPANVARKGTALRAVDLMQQMDSFNSQLRNEAILAELVEIDATREQSRVQNNLNPLRANAGQ